jgi:drug/metabolite transporter (DMT)-like permease
MPHALDPLRTALLTSLALVAFAGNSLLCRLALKQTSIDPASFTSVRLASGALVLALLVAWRGRGQPGAGLPWAAGDWTSALALFVYAAGFSFAYVSLSAATGALLLFGVVQTTMIGWGLWRGERLRPLQWLGLAAASAGLVWLLLPGLATPSLSAGLLMGGAGVAWAVYTLRGRTAGGDPTAVTAGNFLRATPLALGVSTVMAAQMRWDGGQPGVGHDAAPQHQRAAARLTARQRCGVGHASRPRHWPPPGSGRRPRGCRPRCGPSRRAGGSRAALVRACTTSSSAPPSASAWAHSTSMRVVVAVPSRILADTGRPAGTARRTAPRWRHQLGLVQQHRAAAVAVDGLGRAAEVQVDALGPSVASGRRCRPGRPGRTAQQLRAAPARRRRAAAVQQLGHDAREHPLGQQLVGDADELRHAAVDAAHLREDVAQAVVEQALHRRQQDTGGWPRPPRTARPGWRRSVPQR